MKIFLCTFSPDASECKLSWPARAVLSGCSSPFGHTRASSCSRAPAAALRTHHEDLNITTPFVQAGFIATPDGRCGILTVTPSTTPSYLPDGGAEA